MKTVNSCYVIHVGDTLMQYDFFFLKTESVLKILVVNVLVHLAFIDILVSLIV